VTYLCILGLLTCNNYVYKVQIVIWLTVLLGAQRYMCVCFPTFRRLCTLSFTFGAIGTAIVIGCAIEPTNAAAQYTGMHTHTHTHTHTLPCKYNV
jgi:hypothetical protein